MRDSKKPLSVWVSGLVLGAAGLALAGAATAASVSIVAPKYERASTTLLERGIAEISAGRAEAAVAPLQRAITANPRNGAAFTYLARAYDLAGDLPRAHKYFDLALEVEPADRLALSWGGQVDIRQGNLAAAEAKLGRLAELCARGCPSLDELKVALDTRALPAGEDTRLVLDPASDGAVAR